MVALASCPGRKLPESEGSDKESQRVRWYSSEHDYDHLLHRCSGWCIKRQWHDGWHGSPDPCNHSGEPWQPHHLDHQCTQRSVVHVPWFRYRVHGSCPDHGKRCYRIRFHHASAECAFLIGACLSANLCLVGPTPYLALGLADVDMPSNLKYCFPWVFGMSLLVSVIAGVIGVIPF